MTINYLILVDNIDHMNEQVQYTILNVSKMSLIFRFKNMFILDCIHTGVKNVGAVVLEFNEAHVNVNNWLK